MTKQERRRIQRQRRQTLNQQHPNDSRNDRQIDISRRTCLQRRFRSWMVLLALLIFDWWNIRFHTTVHIIVAIPSVLSSSSSSVSFVIPTGRRGRRRSTTTTTKPMDHPAGISSSSYTLRFLATRNNGRRDITTTTPQLPVRRLLCTIPIFPLRKTVKLPGDNITLNLYEPRYRQMVEEAILCDTAGSPCENADHCHQSIPMFGAIYTTNLPHIVVPTSSSQGTDDDTTYIVPILEPNMVGSLFIVTNHTKTIQHQPPRKVIRLNATVILRFRIVEIIHTGGYDNLVQRDDDVDTHCRNATVPQQQQQPHGLANNNKPYIVAQVQLLLSDFDTPICDAVQDRNGADHRRPTNDDDAPRHDDSDDTTPTTTTTTTTTTTIPAVFLLPHYLGDIITQYGTRILLSHFDTSSVDVPSWKTAWIRELLHFYNASSSTTFDNDKRVPLYLEQKERLRILSGE